MSDVEKNQEVNFVLAGIISSYPAKKELSLRTLKGEKVELEVTMEQVDSNVKVFKAFMQSNDTNKKESVGFINYETLTQEQKNLLLDAYKKDDTRHFVATPMSRKGKIAISLVQNVAEVQQAKDTQEFYQNLVNSGVVTQEELDERVKYLTDNSIPQNIQERILSKIKGYSVNVSLNIPSPEVLFVDKGEKILLNALALVAVGSNVIFEGLMGTGKNVLCETIAWLMKKPIYRFSLNSQISNVDLLGGKTIAGDVNNKELTFERSTVIEAFEEGGVLVLDEMNMAQPHILPILNSLLDDAHSIAVPGYKVVKGDPGFIALGTQNPGYIGTHAVNQAISNRFRKIKFKEPSDIVSILETVVRDVPSSFLQMSKILYKHIRNAVQEDALPMDALDVRGFISAARLAKELDYDPKESLMVCIANSATDTEHLEIIKNCIENI